MAIGIRDYQAVLALSDERHFARAARRLKISQPALTSRLYRIEAALGVTLFIRGRSGVEETLEGRAFCEQARQVIAMHEETFARVKEAREGFGMALRVGTTQLAVHQALIESLSQFRRSYPEARVSLVEGTSFGLERDLEKGVLDVAFLHPPIHISGLTQRVLCRANIVLVECSGNPIQDRAHVVRYPRPEAPVMMGSLERGMEHTDHGDTPSLGEANTAITSLALSAIGYGAAFITDQLPDFGFGLDEIEKSEPIAELETSVVYRKLDRRPILQAFLKGVPMPSHKNGQ
ncbi:MAG: LysR family transcriptional regulator [Pseudomonadota bacterium]